MQQKLCQILLLPLLVILFSWSSLTTITSVNGAKILGLFAHPSESHFAVMRSVMTELAKRKHNVTVYSSHRLTEHIDNLEEIIIEPEYPFWTELQKDAGIKAGGLIELSKLSAVALQKSLAAVGAAAVDYFLSHAAMQKLLKLPPGDDVSFDYDLIIVDLFYTEALIALGHLHKKPTVAIVSTNFENYMQHVQESIVPVACSPIDFDNYDAQSIGFWKRLTNVRECISRREVFLKNNFAMQQKLIQKHFTQYKEATPTIPELQAELAVLLLNNHVPLYTPRPLLQNTIAAGGLHIRPARDLPWNIKRFLDESRTGVIYMNFGNEQLCSEIPKDKLQALYNVFAKNKEHVLWTCHDAERMEQQANKLSKNIMFQHVVPQTDILAHPHVKVFIMNGDLLSLQEGISRNVPMLGIPIFRSEIHNMDLAVRLGVAIKLDYSNLTEIAVSAALQTLKLDSAYQLTIRKVSTAFRDRPLGALETCIYWMDYVLRHNSGAAIRTMGVGIASNQLHLFDLFLFYFATALLIVGSLVGVYIVVNLLLKYKSAERRYGKLK